MSPMSAGQGVTHALRFYPDSVIECRRNADRIRSEYAITSPQTAAVALTRVVLKPDERPRASAVVVCWADSKSNSRLGQTRPRSRPCWRHYVDPPQEDEDVEPLVRFHGVLDELRRP